MQSPNFEKDNYNYYIYNNNPIAVYTLSQILDFENAPRETNKYTLMIIETDKQEEIIWFFENKQFGNSKCIIFIE